MKKILTKLVFSSQTILASIICTLFVAGLASATSIGTNISTDGSLTVAGTTTIDTNTLYVDVTNNRVGVGLTNPLHNLHVSGNQEAIIEVDDGGSTRTVLGANLQLNSPISSGYVGTLNNASFALRTNNTDKLYVSAYRGHIGIGTSTDPQNRPEVPAKLEIWGTEGDYNLLNISSSSGTSFLRIDKNGNLGLENSSPQYKLDVNGSVRASSSAFQSINFGIDSGSTDAYVITPNPVISHYNPGLQITFIANTANVGACSVNVNGLGAKSLKMQHDQDPYDNFIESGSVVVAIYDGTNFQIISNSATTETITTEPAVTFSKVTTNGATYVKDAEDVLLYKGKITASALDDLVIEKVNLSATFSAISSLSDVFSRMDFYYIDGNGDEVHLDEETSLTGATAVSFSGFTLNIPKGASNGVYVVVRGDVKNTITEGTLALGWHAGTATTTNYIVKDSENNVFSSDQYTISSDVGHTSTFVTNGEYTLEVNTEETGTAADKNVLAGGVRLLGRMAIAAQYEDAIIEDLVIQATTTSGTSITNDDVATLYLYTDKEMTDLIATADFVAGSNPKALFEDILFNASSSATTYLYIGGLVKGIDYSSSPAADSTAHAGREIVLSIPGDATGYTTKVVGADTGETLTNTYSSTKTKVSTVMGAVITAVTSDFTNDTLTIGKQEVFSFKVTVPSSSNINPDGDPLGVKLASTTFTLAMTEGLDTTKWYIERVGGSNGEKSLTVASSTTSVAAEFDTTYGTDADLIVKPGVTAEFIIKAYVVGVGTSDSLKMSIENMSSNFDYRHRYGVNGVAGSDVPNVYTLIPGLTSVSGGWLSN